MPAGVDVYTLAAYERAHYYPVCAHWRLSPGGPNGNVLDGDAKAGAKRALLDGETIWVSRAMKSLYDDQRDKASWKRFLRNVDVVVVESMEKEWRAAF